MLREEVLKGWGNLKEKFKQSGKNEIYGSYALTQAPLSKVHPGWVARKDILQRALIRYKYSVGEFKFSDFVPDYAKDKNYWEQVRKDQEEISECDWLLKELGVNEEVD